VIEIPGSLAPGDAGHAADVGACCAEWARSGCVAEGGQELKEGPRLRQVVARFLSSAP
jgi:hypothetical protein